MRLEIRIMQEDKTLLLRVTDAEKISAVAGLDSGARFLFEDLLDLANDVAGANPDASIVEISPENAVQVLGAMPLEPAPGGSAPAAAAPAAETPAVTSTVHDSSSTIPPETPAADAAPAAETPAPAAETPAAASTVHDASSTIPPEEPAAAEIPAST